ncbi:hypothetical protein [Nocardia vinacea]
MVAEFEAALGHMRTRDGMAKARAKARLESKQRNWLSPHVFADRRM